MLYTMTKTVTAAGTRERLTATSTPVAWVMFSPIPTNTNPLFVGDSNVSSTRGTVVPKYSATAQNAVMFPPCGGVPNCYNLNQIYIDATTNGEGVMVTYFKL